MEASCLQFAHIINIAYHVIPSSVLVDYSVLPDGFSAARKTRKGIQQLSFDEAPEKMSLSHIAC